MLIPEAAPTGATDTEAAGISPTDIAEPAAGAGPVGTGTTTALLGGTTALFGGGAPTTGALLGAAWFMFALAGATGASGAKENDGTAAGWLTGAAWSGVGAAGGEYENEGAGLS